MQKWVKWMIIITIVVIAILIVFIVVAIVLKKQREKAILGQELNWMDSVGNDITDRITGSGRKVSNLTSGRNISDNRKTSISQKHAKGSYEDDEEVFYYNNGETFHYDHDTVEDAESACEAIGARLATLKDLKTAYFNGSEWCGYGWLKGGKQAYPMGEHESSCERKAGIVIRPPRDHGKAGAICVGKKPVLNTPGIFPFRPGIWYAREF